MVLNEYFTWSSWDDSDADPHFIVSSDCSLSSEDLPLVTKRRHFKVRKISSKKDCINRSIKHLSIINKSVLKLKECYVALTPLQSSNIRQTADETHRIDSDDLICIKRQRTTNSETSDVYSNISSDLSRSNFDDKNIIHVSEINEPVLKLKECHVALTSLQFTNIKQTVDEAHRSDSYDLICAIKQRTPYSESSGVYSNVSSDLSCSNFDDKNIIHVPKINDSVLKFKECHVALTSLQFTNIRQTVDEAHRSDSDDLTCAIKQRTPYSESSGVCSNVSFDLSCSNFDEMSKVSSSDTTMTSGRSSVTENSSDSETDGKSDISDGEIHAFVESLLEPAASTNVTDLEDIKELLEVYEEYNVVDDESLQKLENLNICINWEVPESHKKLSFRYTKEVNESMSLTGCINNSTFFSKKEDEIIIKNWNRFKYEYEFNDVKPFLPGFVKPKIFSDTERRKFVQYLSRELPHRRLRSVYLRFRDLFKRTERKGRFTFKEDQLISNVLKLEKSAVIVQRNRLLMAVLNRSRIAIERRIIYLTKHPIPDKIDWNLELCAKIVKELLSECEVHTVEELWAMEIHDEQWEQVSSKLNCCFLRLKSFWLHKLAVQLLCKKPIYRNKLRIKIIKWFYEKQKEETEPLDFHTIDWTAICNYVKVPSPWFVYQKFRKMLLTYVPHEKLKDFSESIDYLHEHFLPVLESGRIKDYCLTRLKYKKGKLKVLD